MNINESALGTIKYYHLEMKGGRGNVLMSYFKELAHVIVKAGLFKICRASWHTGYPGKC